MATTVSRGDVGHPCKIRNLTPHTVRVLRHGAAQLSGAGLPAPEDVIELPPDGLPARVTQRPSEATPQGVVLLVPQGGVLVTPIPAWGPIQDLPEPRPGVVLVVAALVASMARRQDVVSPDTGGDAIRDANGQIWAVRRLLSHP